MISAITSSTTLRVLEYGALNTATPRSAAPTRSTWLVPMQKHPIASRSVACSRTRRVTVVFERMPSICTPGSAATSSSSLIAPARSSTSNPWPSRISTATGWMFSSSSTFTVHQPRRATSSPRSPAVLRTPRSGGEVLGVHDPVGVALLGEEALTVLGELRVDGVAGDHRVEPGGLAGGLGAQQPAQPLRLLLAGPEGARDLDRHLGRGQVD